MTLNEYAEQIHKTAVEHGWWESDRNFGEVCMLITSEVSEAFEEYRDGLIPTTVYSGSWPEDIKEQVDMSMPDWATYIKGKPEGIAVELADVIIRCLDFMHSAGINIDEVMQLKMAYNESRPYRHGGKLA